MIDYDLNFSILSSYFAYKVFLSNSNYLQNFRLKLLDDFADQRRIVLTTLLPYPGIGESYGSAKTSLINNENIINNPYLLFYNTKNFILMDTFHSLLVCPPISYVYYLQSLHQCIFHRNSQTPCTLVLVSPTGCQILANRQAPQA